MPFVQGHLRNEPLSVSIDTHCAHCSQTFQIEIDSDLGYRVAGDAEPLIFTPVVDFAKLEDPSIIEAF
jgi:hypothetical protein